MPLLRHQYVDRCDDALRDEALLGDSLIQRLLPADCERPPYLYRLLTETRWPTRLLGLMRYDLPLPHDWSPPAEFRLHESVKSPRAFRTPREVFERQIRYWECRPMGDDPAAVVSPADARMVPGSLSPGSALWIKGKFFVLPELLGRSRWVERFERADYAVFRLTPDKYHHNHCPVSGVVADLFAIDGQFHSCHPSAMVAVCSPLSRNRRVVTILDTDVPGGTGVGMVAMIEVVALMVGDIVQCYSRHRYTRPRPLAPGMFLARGCPKSLFRPGSSTVVLLFEPGRVAFCPDLLRNRSLDAQSILSLGLGQRVVETDVLVRSTVARRAAPAAKEP